MLGVSGQPVIIGLIQEAQQLHGPTAYLSGPSLPAHHPNIGAVFYRVNSKLTLDRIIFQPYIPSMDKITKQAVAKAGGVNAVAAALGITKQAVSQWKKIPAAKVRQMTELTGIPAQKLRPDIFGDPILRFRKEATK